MLKVAIMTDSNSGITQNEGKQLGIHILPMPFMINEETFLENVTLTKEIFYERLVADAKISTSQPNLETLMSIWDALLEKQDEVVYIPMSSGLSGSFETAYMIAKRYNGKVQVVNNLRISVTQKQSALDALALAEHGKSAKEILTILEEDKSNVSIYVTLDTLYYLKKGGRITPAAAALGTFLKIKPVLQIDGDKLDAFAKARTISQAKTIMMTAIRKDLNKRFGVSEKETHIDLYVVHSQNLEAAELLREEVQKEFPEYKIQISDLSLSIACHIGPGALAIACIKRLQMD